MARIGKHEPGTSRRRDDTGADAERGESTRHGATERRVLRSQYSTVKSLIYDEREDISRLDSDRFELVIGEVENLHQLVQKPREQVADAETLLDIATTLVTSVQSHGNGRVVPSDFISSLLANYGQHDGVASRGNARNSMLWVGIGFAVSHVFRKVPGCCTMIGPVNTEMKKRKAVAHWKRTRPTESTHPEEVDDAGAEEKTETDKNMSTMFEILRKKRCVRLEHLVLNRSSFAQSVENIFALSFLVKDGRAAITVNENRHHFVLPRNAPSASSVASGEVSYSHFIFRFDFEDWKLMISVVGAGEELMPHRNMRNASGNSPKVPMQFDSQVAMPTTPIRKLSRNRGLIVRGESVVEDDSTRKGLTLLTSDPLNWVENA
ncbi:non-structural maintenance of chromosomes element 4 homolog A-like [Magnolia sinica]|uniref:non-structural maintenance of chromosomes element 4 homolog A-like n=1 Tax=Magnolia sinica TaxID=86752 RepID=UPI0026582711|nr:non-structural maintenance of chromosomes element 4 homolog A-like [Magnolia sinica]